MSPNWVTMKHYPDYEIDASYPHRIRKISNRKVISESLSGGYVQVHLNLKMHNKHRLIALQFIPNPKRLLEVDHINRVRTENRIENLRWSSPSQNSNNRRY
jgi:hypothetical protein